VNRLDTRKIAVYGMSPAEMRPGWQAKRVGNILDEAEETRTDVNLASTGTDKDALNLLPDDAEE
jgi:hypothetical protein